MKALNPKATRVFMRLVRDCQQPGDYVKFDNAAGLFMAVHVECTGQDSYGRQFALAHHYLQNGDVMRDPEMVFLLAPDGQVYPLTFQQDNLGIYQEAVRLLEGGNAKIAPALQKDLVVFANMWLRNIEDQQNLQEEAHAGPDPEASHPTHQPDVP